MLLEKIKFLCKERNITIAELEREMQISNGSISKWSKSKTSADNILKIAKYFEVTMEFLLNSEVGALSSEAFEFARLFDNLNTKQKDLVKCYISII